MKGNFIMKKTVLAVCLMAGTTLASFGAVQCNFLDPWMEGYDQSYYTFDANGAVNFSFENSIAKDTIIKFGYYFLDNPEQLFAGDLATGYLGDFKVGDAIGIWIENDGSSWNITPGIYTTTYTGMDGQYFEGSGSGLIAVRTGNMRLGLMFSLSQTDAPVGEPLPGVIAALAIGGCAFFGRKLRNKMKNNK